jgi:hypothetical protein
MKPFLYNYGRLLLVPCLLFVFFLYLYSKVMPTVPITYWDEKLWVGRSYFFDLYIHGDFSNKIWLADESYDQPKLAEFAYGLWLYPSYLRQKRQSVQSLNYIQFLIQNGFYEIDENYMNVYRDYAHLFATTRLDHNIMEFSKERVVSYASTSARTLHLIYQARQLDILLLSFVSLSVYFIAILYTNIFSGILISFFYATNSLLINTGLIAQSESLFLFTFNLAVLYMLLYFNKERKMIWLTLFSFFTGLCICTKLNGVMLLPMFWVSSVTLPLKTKTKVKTMLTHTLMPLSISIAMFIAINPFVFTKTIERVQFVFARRYEEATVYQAKAYPKDVISNNILRINKIVTNFYFSEKSLWFNAPWGITRVPFPKLYGPSLFVLMLVGLWEIIVSKHKKVFAKVMVSSFIVILISMSVYLILDWDRYYVQLILFFVMFQTIGAMRILTSSYRMLRRVRLFQS